MEVLKGALAAGLIAMAGPAFVSGQARPAAVDTQAEDAGRRLTVSGCVVHEADYAAAHGLARIGDKGTTPQLILVAGGTVYSLTGEQERALARHVNTGVEISGVIEPASRGQASSPVRTPSSGTATPSGATGTTPRGAPAHEPGDALDGTETGRTARAGADPASSRAVATADLPTINVVAYRATPVNCTEALPRASATSSAAAAPAGAAAPRRQGEPPSTDEPVVATGCLMSSVTNGVTPSLNTPEGPAGLLLTKATVTRTSNRPPASAVPGSAPAGGGSGTVGTSGAQPPAGSPVDGTGFVLASVPADLKAHVGRRVEITGIVKGESAGAVRKSDPTVHPSAAERTLVVKSFRVAAGGCS